MIRHVKFDGVGKLQYLLQTMAFCLAIATLQYAFQPERPYAPQVAYSLAIGIVSWAVIDFGRDFFPSAAETGWPPGLSGVVLVAVGMVTGYLLGRSIADLACRTFGWYSGPPPDRALELRTSILITALAGITIPYYFYSTSKARYLQRKMGEATTHANEARLRLLESQLEPHMLFNTLANLRALIAVDPARAQQMLDHMITYLRATLGASRTPTHSLQAEFDRLGDYLALMAIRMGPRLAYSLELPPELALQPVPALLLQPLVENSIQHGLEPKVEGGRIVVSAHCEGPTLVLEVADTGVGPAATAGTPATASGKGFGVSHVRDRLATLYGEAAARLDFAAVPEGGSRVVVRLPLYP